jgi:VWFA-related protein
LKTSKARLGMACLLGLVEGFLQGQGFRERVDVEIVRVDLLATDRQGKPVGDLRNSEIQIKVDGRPVRIESFEAPSLPETHAATALPVPAEPASPLSQAPTPAPRQSYYMAILVDEISSEQSNRQALYEQLFKFLQTRLPPDVEVLLLRFNGALHIECPWTTDLERLRRAAAAIRKRRATNLLGGPGQLNPRTSENGPQNATFDAMEASLHARTSLGGLFDALRIFPEKPGRKALFYLTDGAPFLTFTEISNDLLATTPRSVQRGDPDYERRAALEADRARDLLLDSLAWNRTRSASLLTDIARLALVRGIEIHPVRSAPHDLGGRVSAAGGFHGRATVNGIAGDSAAAPITDIGASQGMEEMARATGGEAVLSRRMFEDGLRHEVATRDAAYLLSFRDPFAGDRRFHRIKIASQRTGLKLRYRQGYRILDARESLIQGAVNRLSVPADVNPLQARLQLDSLGEQNGQAVAEVTIAYPAPPEAGGTIGPAGTVDVIGICSLPGAAISEPIDLTGKAERVSMSDSAWLVRSGKVRLKPGAYRWSFAIRDEQTGITSYLTFDRKLP